MMFSKKTKQWAAGGALIFILALLFFFVYSYLSFRVGAVFNSPDETANYFFTRLFAKEGTLSFFESLNFIAANQIHPRSTTVVNGYIVPGSFLGIILLFGWIAKLIGAKAIIYLTPAFAVLGVLCFYAIIVRIFPDPSSRTLRVHYGAGPSSRTLRVHYGAGPSSRAKLPEGLRRYVGAYGAGTTGHGGAGTTGHGADLRGRNNNMALLSSVLLIVNPIFWYYASRPMYHNALFVSLLLVGGYFFVSSVRQEQNQRKSTSLSILSGLCLGLALAVRTVEILWVAPLGILFFGFYRKKIGLRRLFIVSAVVFLVFLPIFYHNQVLYGSPLGSGYLPEGAGQDGLSGQGDLYLRKDIAPARGLLAKLLPFGIHPRVVWHNAWHYYLKLLWWFAILIGLGGIILLYDLVRKRTTRGQSVYFIGLILVASWQLIYYGSRIYSDNPSIGHYTIGNSFLRYLLPSLVLAAPLAAMALLRIAYLVKSRIYQIIIMISLLGFLGGMSFYAVFYSLDDGLVKVKENILAYKDITSRVLELTKPEAVIITARADKFFFPKRRIINPYDSGEIKDEVIKLLPVLLVRAPVYYYGIGMSKQEQIDFEEKLGVKIERVEIFGKETLYKLGGTTTSIMR